MSAIETQALVGDLVSECNGTGTGPFTLFNTAGVTSGQVYDKIAEANANLQGWIGAGQVNSAFAGNPVSKIFVKSYEVNYGSARLAASLAGIIITDDFNVTIGGLAIQREQAAFNEYQAFVKNHLMIAQEIIKMLHQWFFPYNPTMPQGVNEFGAPVTYWSTTGSRY